MFVTSFDGGSLSSCAMAVVFSFFSTIFDGFVPFSAGLAEVHGIQDRTWSYLRSVAHVW